MAGRNNRAPGTNRPAGRGSARQSYGDGGTSLTAGSSRIAWLLVIMIVAAALLLLRLVYLQVIVAGEYSAQAQEARTSVIDISPRRGTIYDRNGVVLATSVDATTVYANPKEVEDADGAAAQISAILGGDIEDYKALLKEDTSFVYLKRKADVETADRLGDLGIKGIHFLEDTKRVYPNNQVGGQIVGFVNIDGEGIAGLELYYDEILKGSPGSLVIETGVGGLPIPGGIHEQTHAVNGQDIIVSIDIGMQEYLESTLVEGVKSTGGASGNAVVMDGGTGEIYACASLPLFNPSDTSQVEEGATTLKSITSPFEPGSIFKTVSALAILEAGTMKPEDELFCPAYLPSDEYYISDAHERGDETMTFRTIINQSSNVGMSLATEKLGFGQLYDKILKYNLNEPTGVDYPGDTSGYLLDRDQWSLTQGYNVSFGQGVSVTPLQMVRFYGALTNNGVECTPHFLLEKPQTDEVAEYATEDVIDNKAAIPTMVSMLETVVTDGTAKQAAIEGYTVAGKTGTAEFVGEDGLYVNGVSNISFVGFLPNSSSQLVCFVGSAEVPGDGQTCFMFKDIMSFAIDRYKIVPNEG